MTPSKLPAPRDPSTEARDRWIYERCYAGAPYDAIIEVLNEAADRLGWRPIASKQGVYCAALRHAERHGLARPDPRPVGRERGRV